MKIRSVSCTQFAGIADKTVAFSDGMNVIVGENESGKSTVVNLIAETIFRNAKLDGRSDRDFIASYYPGKRRDGAVQGDFIDGTVTLENENGVYTVSKEWSSTDWRSLLKTPSGTIKDPAKIEEILRGITVYGKGVYTEMLLSSQKNTDAVLRDLLDGKVTDEKAELLDAVTSAFAQSDGVTVDAIEQGIKAKIEAIAGQHWNAVKGEPVKRNGGARWSNGLGEILKAKYELEDAENALGEMRRLEEAANRAAESCSECQARMLCALQEKKEFEGAAKALEMHSDAVKLSEVHRRVLEEYEKVLEKWPEAEKELRAGEKLRAERSRLEAMEKYLRVKQYTDSVKELSEKLSGLSAPSEEEIKIAKDAALKITRLESKLCGMNINAQIKKLSETCNVSVRSLRTGETLMTDGENVNITEAVILEIPGIADITLAPANVDAERIKSDIAEKCTLRNTVLEKYSAADEDALSEMKAEYERVSAALSMAKANASVYLDGSTVEELEKQVPLGEKLRSAAEINADITALCKDADISRFVIAAETMLKSYADRYGSIEELSRAAEAERTELKKAMEAVSTAAIPEKYSGINDPKAHLEGLCAYLDECTESFRASENAKTAAQVNLERYTADYLGGRTASDLEQEVAEAERRFTETKELLGHWLHIMEVFEEKREELSGNPMQDIADRFSEYLAVLSSGSVSSELSARGRLDVSIYSGESALDYIKLSEGTKETVSLAFRLAVLDHLFPEGGGVAVFDDPFTDMDRQRYERACRLLREFSQRHQVIVLTCREEYVPLLGGNRVEL